MPHIGGPILPPGDPTTLIEGKPAATVGDLCVCSGPPDTIVLGSFTVLIAGRPAARVGDSTVHGGTITLGATAVLIGDQGGGAGSPMAATMAAAKASGAALVAQGCNSYGPEEGGQDGGREDATVPPTTWIDVELVDEHDQPVPYRRYRVTASDGRVFEGYVGPAGIARVTGVSPGECKVDFPDLDASAWEPL